MVEPTPRRPDHSRLPRPQAVLLDVGGIFHLPDHQRIRDAMARGGFTADGADFDRAHYAGAIAFTGGDAGTEWRQFWRRYLDAYVDVCGVPVDLRSAVHRHLASEFAVATLWARIIPGSVDGLRALRAAGVRVGVVSNADGTVQARLAEQSVLQVGPGTGVEVECVIDSAAVGVSKPDPRIFRIALEAMELHAADAWYVGDTPAIDVTGARAAGLVPIVMDPYGLHEGADYVRVRSLVEVSELVRSG
jgi:putative hydrolase of the HAD superfamily